MTNDTKRQRAEALIVTYENLTVARAMYHGAIKKMFPEGSTGWYVNWGNDSHGPYQVKCTSGDRVQLYNPATRKMRWVYATAIELPLN